MLLDALPVRAIELARLVATADMGRSEKIGDFANALSHYLYAAGYQQLAAHFTSQDGIPHSYGGCGTARFVAGLLCNVNEFNWAYLDELERMDAVRRRRLPGLRPETVAS